MRPRAANESGKNSAAAARVRRLREALESRVVILDGGTGTCLARECPEAARARCPEGLVLTHPEAVTRLHRNYLAAGAEVVETNTFGANTLVLDELDLASACVELNRRAAALARAACDAAEAADPGRPRWVAGAMGPTNRALTLSGDVTFARLVRAYAEQAAALAAGGVDLLLVETVQDPLNLKAALVACRDAAPHLPVAVSLTVEADGRLLGGQSVAAAAVTAEPWQPLWIGLNCSSGPAGLEGALAVLTGTAPCPVAVAPNAGLPDGNGNYLMGPEVFAAAVARFAAAGWVNVAGGCCGTTPEHVAALTRRLSGMTPRRPPVPDPARLAGGEMVNLAAANPPLLVGERTNVLGSRRFRELTAAGSWVEAAELGRGQTAAGAAVLDVCVASSNGDESAAMGSLLPVLRRLTRVPLMLDSTDPEVLAAALELAPGRPVINSVNLEDGGARLERVAGLARRFGAAVVAGCIDEHPTEGMALTAGRKAEIAARLLATLEGLGLRRREILMDPLVFPAAAGVGPAGGAAETVAGLRLIKKRFPDALTIVGVSNVSFGLPAKGRQVLNSVFLDHCVRAGLDVAIADPAGLIPPSALPPEDRLLAEELLFAGGDAATAAFADRFRKAVTPATASCRESIPVARRLAKMVAEGRQTGLAALLDEALEAMDGEAVINGPLLDGMNAVGRRFQAGELTMAEVLTAAEVMEAALRTLERSVTQAAAPGRGSITLATVAGDVHDIGKNLVGMVLAANGFEVVDLGVQCPAERLVTSWRERPTDLIGLSGLLVRSTREMVAAAEALAQAGVRAPLLLGGAALTEEFVASQVAPRYPGPVTYAADVMDGLAAARTAMGRNTPVIADHGAAKGGAVRRGAGAVVNGESERQPRPTAGSDGRPGRRRFVGPVVRRSPLPAVPDLDRHLIADLPLDEALAGQLPGRLTRRHLGRVRDAGNGSGDEVVRRVARLQQEAVQRRWVRAAAVYRFAYAWRHPDGLALACPDGEALLPLAAGPGAGNPLSLVASSRREGDSVALFVVTAGSGIRDMANRWRREGRLLDSLALEVLALEAAEAAAEWLHRRLDGLWRHSGLPGADVARGRRISPGYPACPDLDAQRVLFQLLAPEEIGLSLTGSCMMDPEASVSAVVFHAPSAGAVS